MDLNQLSERDRISVSQLIEAKQASQFVTLYSTIVEQCFADCIGDFTSETMSNGEKNCIKNCTRKFLNLTNRIGTQMAEKQMMPGGGLPQ